MYADPTKIQPHVYCYIMENMSSKSLKTPFNLYLRLIQKKDLSFMWNSYIDYKLTSCELQDDFGYP